MKKKFWKVLALVLALAMIIGLGWFANSLLGNPISKALAERAAEKHLEEYYSGTDYYVERIGYNFKFGTYHAFILSPTSEDTQFSLRISMWGEVYLDTYEDVLSGSVTARRLNEEYRALTDTVLQDPDFPYACHIDYGRLEIYPQEALDDPNVSDIPDYCIVQDTLILDGEYDIRELGKQAGHLIIYIDSESISPELGSEILLAIREEFDRAGIPFRAIDLTLQYPLPEEGPRPDAFYGVSHFPYAEIYADGMAERFTAADQALKDYYASFDK